MRDKKVGKPDIQELLNTRYIKVYDLSYPDGLHYYDASRRAKEDLLAGKTQEELMNMLPDAVCAILIVRVPGEEPKLVLFYEYRYPTGQYQLGVPAGLVDPQDKNEENPLITAMIREIWEETGVQVKDTDKIYVANPLAFTTSGFTDECTAMVCAVVDVENTDMLNPAGAEGSERFDGFELVTKAEAKELLKKGKDRFGHYYPLVVFATLTYFVSDLWQED